MSDDVRAVEKHKININKILIAIIVILVLTFSVLCYVVGFSGIYTVIKNEQGATAMNVYHVCTEKDVEKYNEMTNEYGRAMIDASKEKIAEVNSKQKKFSESIKNRENVDKDATCQYIMLLIAANSEGNEKQFNEALEKLNKLKNSNIYPSNYINENFDINQYLNIKERTKTE